MKKSPQDSSLFNNFKPSKFSGSGFMGSDTRTIEEIISADEHFLHSAGVTSEIMADALSGIFDRTVNAPGNITEVGDGIFATYYESRGSIPCPFRGHSAFAKGEVVLTDKIRGKEIIITRLAIHLIKEHKFFQGAGNRFRIDPAAALEILGLK